MRNPIRHLMWMLLAIGSVACSPSTQGAATPGPSTGVTQLDDSSGVGQLMAVMVAPRPADCPPSALVGPADCFWKWTRTRGWVLMCRVGHRLLTVDASGLSRLRRDSSGVGQD